MKTMEGGEAPFDWAVLVPRIVHPLKVAIVEALLYVEQPLSAIELCRLFDEPSDNYVSKASYHVRELAKAGSLAAVRTRQVRGATETFYFFPLPLSRKPAP